MHIQTPQWTEFLSCPICTNEFNESPRLPVSLGCGHTVCKLCLSKLSKQLCPLDQTDVHANIDDLPVNHALLQLALPDYVPPEVLIVDIEEVKCNQENFDYARKCIEMLSQYLVPLGAMSNGISNGKLNQVSKSAVIGAINNGTTSGGLTRPMQRKLVTLLNCQLVEEEGRCRAVRAARSLGERTVKELILMHQNQQHLSTYLWTAVRNRGCQFLGPALQEEVLKFILLALEDGNALSRKVLVLFVVQRLESKFTQASKTSIGHVVQLLYRASCFKITKREGDSSLLQLHEKFRTYSSLRKEHDAQVVQIATEAGLHISPEQWSALLYGDDDHKSHMQSIIDKLQTPASFSSSIQELIIALQRTQDPADLQRLREDLQLLADIDPSPEADPPSWQVLKDVMTSLKVVVVGLVDFVRNHSGKLKSTMEAQHTPNKKYKTSMCRDIVSRTSCPRGTQCNFAHTTEELERFRKKRTVGHHVVPSTRLDRSGSSSSPETFNSSNGLDNVSNGSRDSPDDIIRNSVQSIAVHPSLDMHQASYYKSSNGNCITLDGPLANAQPLNRASIMNAAQMNGGRIANGTRISNGTHLPNGSIASNGTANHMMNGAHLKNSAQLLNGAILSNGGSSPYAGIEYQRHTTVQTNAPVNALPVTYLQSPVQHMQPSQAIQLNGNDQRLGMFYPPCQQNYIQANMPVYSNNTSLLQMSQQCQPFVAQHPHYYQYGHLARGISDKDKDDDLDKSTEYKKPRSRGIFDDSNNDDLKLETGRSSILWLKSQTDSSLNGGKIRESSIGSGLDTSSEYSSETFSPLSNESCGSPLALQTQNYASAWNQFESSHSDLKESRESSSSHNSLSSKANFDISSIWSPVQGQELGSDKDLFVQRSQKSGCYSKTDRNRLSYNQDYISGFWRKKQGDEDKTVGLNYSRDTQSSFEEASSDDIFSPWTAIDRKPVGAPPGLQQQQQQQQAPIGTKSAAHYSARQHEHLNISRHAGRHNFSSVSLPDGVAFD